MTEVFWIGDPPDQCNICGSEITTTFVDGRTRAHGSWACMCLACHQGYGVGLGTGNGQVFTKQDDGQWLKVEG
jgi:hypothetical protein